MGCCRVSISGEQNTTVIGKDRRASLQYEWDTFDLIDGGAGKVNLDEPRPDFKRKVRTTRVNPITGVVEQYMPARERCAKIASSFSIVAMMVCLLFLLFTFHLTSESSRQWREWENDLGCCPTDVPRGQTHARVSRWKLRKRIECRKTEVDCDKLDSNS